MWIATKSPDSRALSSRLPEIVRFRFVYSVGRLWGCGDRALISPILETVFGAFGRCPMVGGDHLHHCDQLIGAPLVTS